MPRVTYIAADSKIFSLDGAAGMSLMQLATSEGVPGIIGECGGVASCATCHVYVDPSWFDKLPAAKADERAMLEFADDVRDTSRLGCQIRLRSDLDGIVVTVAKR
jgi:2Fe-2S ferredoxin